MANTTNDNADNRKAAKKDSLLLRTVMGKLLSSDLFARHYGSIVLVIGMILVYITNRYQCLTRMEEIRKLNRELEIVETERVRVKSLYMSRIRESSMQELVDTMHLNLQVQDRPPYQMSPEK